MWRGIRWPCPQGEPLTWLGYDGSAGEHWFGVGAEPELCRYCWEAAHCPRQFAYPPAQHETLLGRLPLANRLVQRVLQQVRPWIEPAQSFEKNQLGLGDVFLNQGGATQSRINAWYRPSSGRLPGQLPMTVPPR
jgi:hypothetical protein